MSHFATDRRHSGAHTDRDDRGVGDDRDDYDVDRRGIMTPQIQPIGAHPDVDVLLIGALLWSNPNGLLDLIADDDIEDPALAAVLAAIRTLAGAGKPCGPQLVLDELRRRGAVSTTVAEQLVAATTCGADPLAARHYAAAAVAESLRRRVESAGAALVAAGAEVAEADLAPLVGRAAESVLDCARRLVALRGESP
jgi:replicative DNA helicase